MNQAENSKARGEVIRDTIVLQLKLIVDGLRDLILMPVCLLAAIVGLIFHPEKPGRYLYRILNYGRFSEQWIGLFDDAQKDEMEPIKWEGKNFDDLIIKTQNTFESKYVDPEKKEMMMKKMNDMLNEINGKVNHKKNPNNHSQTA